MGRFVFAVFVAGVLGRSAFGLTLAPGGSGVADGTGIGAGGTVIDSVTADYTEILSDAGNLLSYTTAVEQTSNGLVFTYRFTPQYTNFVTVPNTLILAGFGGVTTDVYLLAGSNPGLTWTASRSADGGNLRFQLPGDRFGSDFTVEVRTDAEDYDLGSATVQPTYWVYPYGPPGGDWSPYLQTFPLDGFAPAATDVGGAIPEPSALMLLPLAIGALAVRLRRR